MAQTLEELAAIMETIQQQAEVNNANISKMLAGINSQLDYMEQNTESEDLIKIYLTEMKKVLEERHTSIISEFSKIEKAASALLKLQNDSIKANDLERIFSIFSNNMLVIKNELSAQGDNIQKLHDELDILKSDKAGTTEVLEAISMLKNDSLISDKNFEKIITEICDNTKNIIKNLVVMDPSEQNDRIKTELENIYISTESLLSNFRESDQKIDNITSLIEMLSDKKDLESAQVAISGQISESGNVINESLKEISSKIDDIALATNDSKILYEFENLKNVLNAKNEELIEDFNPNKINAIQDLLENLSVRMSTLSQDDLQNNSEDIKSKIIETFENITGKIESINFEPVTKHIDSIEHQTAKIEDKLAELAEISNKLQSSVDVVNASNMSKLGVVQTEITNRIESTGETINNNINLLKEALIDTEKENILTEKLLAIRDVIIEKSENQNDNVLNLQRKIEEFLKAGERISNDAEVKIGNSVSELADLKSELGNIFSTFSNWDYDRESHDVKMVGVISSEIDDLKNLINTMQDSVQNGLYQSINSNSESMERQINNLIGHLDNLKEELIKQDDGQQISEIDNELKEIKDKINALKQEVNLVNTDIVDIINSRAQALMLEITPVKAALEALSGNHIEAYEDQNSSDEENQEDSLLSAINDLKNTIDNYSPYNEELKFSMDELKNTVGARISESSNSINELLDIINEKIDILSNTNQNENKNDIEEIKNIISQQKEIIVSASSDKLETVEQKLKELLDKIDMVVTSSNNNDMRDSIIDTIINVFEQISFIEESEDIKDFVEVKTDEINQNIIEFKKQLDQFVNGEDEYSYTLQDVESDIAKLRLVLNELSNNTSQEEISDISENIHHIVKSVEDMQTTLTQEQISGLKTSFEKLSEDVLSISSRTNKLILTSDESFNALNNGLNDFTNVISQLESRINYLDNKEITERIEEKLESTYNVVTSSANSDKVMRQALMYMGEWIDTASEKLENIITGSAEQGNDTKEILSSLEELHSALPEQKQILNKLEIHFDEQQERMDRLESKLEKVLSAIDNIDDTKLQNKVDKIDKQIKKLTTTVEKLATYVDE